MNVFKAMTVRDVVYLLLTAAYSVLFIVGHDLVSRFYGWLITGLDRKSVEDVLLWGTVLVFGGSFVTLAARRRKEWLFWVEGAVLGVLLWISSTMLICTNIECVHYPQYAILGFLVRCLVGDDMTALLACNLVGMGDEFIQYVLNPHYTKYLDFNDMVLNMIGAMVGIWVWRWAYARQSNPLLIASWKRIVAFCYAVMTAIIVWAVADERLLAYWSTAEIPHSAVQLVGAKSAFVLSYVDTSAFYLTTGLGRKYHVMNAVEWGGVSLVLLVLAWGLSHCGRSTGRRG